MLYNFELTSLYQNNFSVMQLLNEAFHFTSASNLYKMRIYVSLTQFKNIKHFLFFMKSDKKLYLFNLWVQDSSPKKENSVIKKKYLELYLDIMEVNSYIFFCAQDKKETHTGTPWELVMMADCSFFTIPLLNDQLCLETMENQLSL